MDKRHIVNEVLWSLLCKQKAKKKHLFHFVEGKRKNRRAEERQNLATIHPKRSPAYELKPW